MTDRPKAPEAPEAQNPESEAASSTPSASFSLRRAGARHEVSERVSLRGGDGRTLEGWALNMSRGGLRVILEERVVLGQTFDVTIGGDAGIERVGRIVWLQAQPDGVVCGIEFVGVPGAHRSMIPAPADSERLPRSDDEAPDGA